MKIKLPKQLPYGNANFKSVRTEKNYVYVDKTRFIELLENESNNSKIFIRPRRFGKSLFISMLSYYYDVNYADEFEQLFGNLYIGKNPTPLKNSYAVMGFNFSGINTSSIDAFKNSFLENIRNAVRRFLDNHKNIFPNTEQILSKIINHEYSAFESFDLVLGIAESAGLKIFVIIDEYDHFANDLIAMGSELGDDFYRDVIHVNGIVRDFYEKLKIASGDGIIGQTFITGISPVMLDDLTSGYNIADNLTLDLQYNEMLGFTRNEVNSIMNEINIDASKIEINMERYYNGYLFNEEAENKIYNSSMIFYFFSQILKTGKSPKYLIDPNLSIDSKRLRRLCQNEKNRNILLQIIKDGGIVSRLLEKFSIDNLVDDDYFVSLLFYMGLLTINGLCDGQTQLTIPNYSIQRIYWEQVRFLIAENSKLVRIDTSLLEKSIKSIAIDGNINNFISYISKNVLSKISNYDLQNFDEKYIKAILLTYLILDDNYIPISESEIDSGRVDIFLQRNPKYSAAKYEWVLELKYCKTASKKSVVDQKRKEGLDQLN
ncbi:MAG: ATP-binding protein, partial [Planctomycetaceae bacterium]|nr:ATP-binding protein [Planctomycetaceae bacterium]